LGVGLDGLVWFSNPRNRDSPANRTFLTLYSRGWGLRAERHRTGNFMQLQCDGRTESAWPKSNLTAIDRALSNNEERNVEKSILDSHGGVYAIYIPRFFVRVQTRVKF